MNLYPFQQEVIKEMLHFLTENDSHATYNACEQGCGKSRMSIAAAEYLRTLHNIIVCPAVMRLVWADEIEKWQSEAQLPICPILTASDIDKVNLNLPSWIIVSYALVTELKVLNFLADKKYDLLILDEAHYCKNMRARRTRACLVDLWPKCTHRILLSGTPCTTSIVDLYTAARRCAPAEFKDFDGFAKRYTHVRIHPQWGARYIGLRHGDELKAKLRKYFFIRRTKAEVLPDLPPKTYQQISLPSNLAVVPKTKDEASKLEAEIASVAEFIKAGKAPVIPKTLAEHRRLQGERKIPAVVEFCENLLQQEIPIVVFGHHKSFIAGLSEQLRKYSPAVITGATLPNDRAACVRAFQSGQTNLFIANLVAGGVGITLTRSSIVVLGELDWAPSTVAQAVDRCHRIGTVNPVTIYYFVVKDSIDEIISRTVINRAKTISKVVDN